LGALTASGVRRRNIPQTTLAATAHRIKHNPVKRPATFFARLIAALLLVQTVLAPALCLAHAASAGLATVICSPDGDRTVHLGADGQELPAPEAHSGFCLACHALPQADIPAGPMLSAPAELSSAIIWLASGDAGWRPAARAPPYDPTGPPAFS
jgi:hypothetical protein